MKTSIFTRAKGYLQTANQWFSGTPERALDQAYDAALMIKAIEDEHFDGNKITFDFPKHSDNVSAYFQSELRKYLKIARLRLSEFTASRSLISNSNLSMTAIDLASRNQAIYPSSGRDQPSIILEKLKFIDDVLNRYKPGRSSSSSLVPVTDATSVRAEIVRDTPENGYRNSQIRPTDLDLDTGANTASQKTGALPRSILSTLNRIQRELDPRAEEKVVQNFRSSKTKTIISIKFILSLILIPLLTFQLSKNFVVGPVVDHFRGLDESQVFLNFELEEEGLMELQRFEERLKFEQLIGLTPSLSAEQSEDRVKEKAAEIAEEYRVESSNAIKNVFADFLSLIAFALVIVANQREIQILKSFIDEIAYGLSDSAKAFIIILFTDIFVGFHSPHGWEVLLEGISRHLGLPANRDFIFLFIATFPVILDTVFKYWIFRYLNQISPSAVATYRNMNE